MKLPAAHDKTLSKLDEILEEEERKQRPRGYLGMSAIGEECERKLFYSYRQVRPRNIPASGIRAIQDGFNQENVMAARLRKIPNIELVTHPNGQQIGFKDVQGHFCGHCDGMIRGLLETPAPWHVWEHKSVNEKKFNDLLKKRNEHGEKKALELWDNVYYVQAQIYMHYSEVKKHYLTVSTPGGRDYVSIRTDYKATTAKQIIKKAEGIINDNWTIPAKISDKREFFKCKWCEFSGVCHDKEVPDLNCRTCRYCEPVEGGKFNCLLNDKEAVDVCENHIYNPALIDAKLLEHADDGCVYKSGIIKWANINAGGFPDDPDIGPFYTSQELYDLQTLDNIDPELEKVKTAFQGEIDPDAPEWDSRFKGD